MTTSDRRYHGPGSVGPGRTASRRRLRLALVIVATFFVVEAVAGYLTNSLALLADAGHLLTDVAALSLALLALWFASRPVSNVRSYGYYRAEVFAALANGLTLWAVAGYIVYEALGRLRSAPEVEGLPVLLVALAGLVAQSGAAMVLHRSAGESINVKGAYVHVLTDAIQTVAVVFSGVLILAFGWYVVDPVVSLLIAVLIFWSGGRVAWEAAQVLMEHSPTGVDVEALCSCIESVEGITGVHDLHIWSITTGYEVLSAHVTTDAEGPNDRERLLESLQGIAATGFDISHVTIQLEGSAEGCVETHHQAHLGK